MAQEQSFGTPAVPIRVFPLPAEGDGRTEIARRIENIHVKTASNARVALEDNATIVGYLPDMAPVRTTVILPAYNEAQALPSVLNDLIRALDDSYEIMVVDDGSSDDTAEVARRYPCRLIVHEQNQGKGAAVRTGLLHAQGEAVIIMDADNTYPAEAIPGMVGLLANHDFVRGIRAVDKENTPLVNRVGNKAFDSVLKVVYGLEGGDHLSGLYGLRKDAFESMKFMADGFDLEVEIGIKARAHELRTSWLPIDYKERIGEKKLNPVKDGWRIMQKIMALTLLYNPARMFLLPGVLMLVFSVVLALTLKGGPAVIPAIGLTLHSFVIMALGVAVSLQVFVYGLVAALYAVEKGVRARVWLINLSGRRVRLAVTSVGALLTLAGTVILVSQISNLATFGGSGVISEAMVLAGVLLLSGLQAILAVMFLSIFASHLDKLATSRSVKARIKPRTAFSKLRRARS